MSEDPSIYRGFLRGNPRSQDARQPELKFQDERKVLASEALRFSKDNAEGKFFLGVAGADVIVDPDMPRLPDGRTNRYAVGGQAVGVGDDRHIFTVANNRGGKGRCSIVPNARTYPGSMLIIDPKSEVAMLSAAKRKELGQEVYVVAPYDDGGVLLQPFAASFNPMDILKDSPDAKADARLIAGSLIISAPGTKDPHWDLSAESILEGLILHVATSSAYEGRRNLVTVYELIWRLLVPSDNGSSPKARYALQDEMERNLAVGGAIKHAAQDFYERADRERDSVLSTLRRHLHFLGYEKIQKVLRSSSFDLRDLKRKPVTIYLSLPAMRMGSCAGLLRLFVNLTLASMEMEKTRPRYPVLMCLDEFAVLGHMKSIEDAAGQISGLGCRLWPILQDLSQLKALYSERWETFLANAGIIQCFANSDLTTLEWISKRLGTTTVTNYSQSNVPYQAATTSGSTGKSWSTATCELMTPGEIAQHFGRDDELLRQLIIRPSVAPLVLHRAFYDKHEFFRDAFPPSTDKAGR